MLVQHATKKQECNHYYYYLYTTISVDGALQNTKKDSSLPREVNKNIIRKKTVYTAHFGKSIGHNETY